MRAIEDVLSESVDPAARAMVKFRLANFLAWGIAELDAAERACEEARSLFVEAGVKAGALLAENELAWIRGLARVPGHAGRRRTCCCLGGGGRRSFRNDSSTDRTWHNRCFSGAVRGSRGAHRRSIAIAEQEAKTYRLTTSRALLACSLAFEGRPGEASGLVSEAKEQEWRETLLPEWEAIVQWFAGDFPGALASSQAAAAQLVGGLSKRRALGVAFAALAAVEGGEAAQARDHLSRVGPALGGIDFLCAGFAAGHAEALLDWYEGHPSDALAGLSGVADGCIAAGAAAFAGLVLVDLAEVAAELGDTEAAVRAARRLYAISQEIDRDLYYALAAMAEGWSLLADGSMPSAEAAHRAVELLSASGCRGIRARALEQLARALLATDVVSARAAVEEATTLFRECGAVWRLDRARELKRAFYGPRHRTVSAARRRSHRTRETSRAAGRGRPHRSRDRRAIVHQLAHGRNASGERLRQIRRPLEDRTRRARIGTRAESVTRLRISTDLRTSVAP